MINFFVKNDLFTPVHFGYRSDHSRVHAVSEITDYIRDAIDKTFTGQTCFIDLRKPFDSLDYCQLLNKLYNYGFRGPIFHIMSVSWQNVFHNERITGNFMLLLVNLRVPSWAFPFSSLYQ